MSNFLFLKKNNENLFKIISEAENLFRDEYFEQSVVQIRRFAENLCKDLLQEKVLPDDTFDSMISKIKDNSFGNTRMKEFADDLYFLKKHGNTSAHSSSASQNGKIALECLERAYEISIFYSSIKYGYNKKLDKTVFSEELLMSGKITGKKSSPKLLKDKYSNELKKSRAQSPSAKNIKSKKPTNVTKLKKTQKISKKRSPKNKKNSKNKVLITIIVIAVAVFVYFLLSLNS